MPATLRVTVPSALLFLLAAALPADAQQTAPAAGAAPRFYTSPDSAMKGLPFSEAVQVGNVLYLSGQIGVLPGTSTLQSGGIVPEARQTLENIGAILRRHGASPKDVVKCTVFLADMAEWGAFNGVYREFFSPPYPARSAFGANGLARNARVEVECVAVLPQGAAGG
jgi:2-iminobutanoate/2-iminopropanoate deaminase